MTMGSRRSSDGDTSADDLDLKNSISLEFDDYPLDLVSPLCQDEYSEHDLLPQNDWIMPSDTMDFGDSTDAYLTDDTFKFINERDRFITDEIITDFGNRKSGEYTTVDEANGEVFVRSHDGHMGNGLCPVDTGESNEDGGTPRTNCCKKLKTWLCNSCKLCLSRYYTVPDSPAWYDRWRYALLCPPHGWLSHLVTLVLLTLMCWGLMWAVDKAGASYGGGLFAILALTVCSYTAGRLVECIRFPPLLGMFVVGCVMKNVVAIDLTTSISPHVIIVVRELGMASLVLRSGLALIPRSLRLQSLAVLRLTVIPSLCEAVSVGLLAKVILDMPWLWAFLLGFLMCACGPAVANPLVLSLQARGYGLDKDIPSLVVGASSADTILPLTGFSVILSILLNHAPLVLTVFRGPLEAMGGVIGAMVLASILWYIPHKQHPQLPLVRVCLLAGSCYVLSLGSWAVGCSRMMPIGCITLVFVTITRWRKDQHKFGEKSVVEEALKTQWCIIQPLYYAVLGLHADVSAIKVPIVGPSIAVILLGCVIRMVITTIITFRTSLNHKEKVFVSLAWLPKSSVQLAMCSLALATAQQLEADEYVKRWAQVISAVCVLTVLVTLPLGGILTTLTAPYLLAHSCHLIHSGEAEKVDLEWEENVDFNPQWSKLRISEISNVTTEVEITTERETVT